jgi:hypothetical protein
MNNSVGRKVFVLEADEYRKTEVYVKDDVYTVRRMLRRGIHHDVQGTIDLVHAQVVDDVINGMICVFNELFTYGVDECFAHQKKKYQAHLAALKLSYEPDTTKTEPLTAAEHVDPLV